MAEKKIKKIQAEQVVLGNQTNFIYQLQVPVFQPPPDLAALRQAYCQHLRRTYRALDFKGIPQLEAFTRELLLEDVYIPLIARPERPSGETWERQRLAGRALNEQSLPEEALAGMEKASAPPQPVEQAVGENARLVVLGDPGSGKSTLLKHLALRLAGEAQAPLPILAPLNAYAAVLAKDPGCNLQRFLPQYFAGLTQGVANLQPLFDAALAQGQALVLLDGLDEIQSDLRGQLVHRVETFSAEAAALGCRVVVTSRIVGYSDAPLTAGDWALYTLLDFTPDNIQDFAARWCLAFEKSTLGDSEAAQAAAERERKALLEGIEANPGVGQLASNPLLLTILALIKRQGVSLPNRRVELYELYLKTLISSWSRARALDKQPVGPALDYLETISILGPLALWLRETNPTAGLVSEEALLKWLKDYFRGDEWELPAHEAQTQARAFLQAVHHYSNLLVERGQGRYGFIHLTFEEALAGRGIVQLGQLERARSLDVIRQHLEDPAWRETILLAVGIWGLVREEPRIAGEVVKAMLGMPCGAESPCRAVLLAGACLEDVGELGIGRAPARLVQEALQAAALNRGLPPAVQRDAGFILGRLAGSSAEWLARIRPDLDDFIQIPAGEFLYGDQNQPAQIEHPYAAARYPVTNLQFRRFVDAGGYAEARWWSETGWAWRTGKYDTKAEDQLKNWLERRPPQKRGEPFFWHNPDYNNPLAPVVGVSWFEAEAYCTWLAAQTGRAVRLPSEMEWERAARGREGRVFAWGDAFDFNRLNCAEFWAQTNAEAF